ncbi:MAG: glycine--tRNA ligase subunit beta [Rhodospirillaceae bacterium]
MAEFLLELFSEEIPARMQARAAADLKRIFVDGLQAAGLDFGSARAFVTPRRLALVIDDLPLAQADRREEKRGPRADAPEKAIAGFLGSVGLSRAQVEERETPKGLFLFAVVEQSGRPTADLLVELSERAVRDLPWPKSQRWARNTQRYVRPLQAVLAIFDGVTLTGEIDLGDWRLRFTDETRGHRFLAPEPLKIQNFKDYQAQLADAYVILDRADRKARILEQATALAAAEGLRLIDDPGLLDEVAGLIEWPHPLMGTIDSAFMEIPPEVLTTSMRSHQKYFALEDSTGKLANRFVVVANMAADADRDQTIIAGNERVLRARLSDAKFFWDTDRDALLASRVAALGNVTFYEKLGGMADKVTRMTDLADYLARSIDGCDHTLAVRAAHLAKADLTTAMVYEFPEVQGIMGQYYARHDAEPEAVAAAIAEHYAPAGPSDDCPTAPVSIAVALADKIDLLVGFFAIDEKPTGSKDPFALRRAALGVIRLVVENQLRLPLQTVFDHARSLYGDLTGPGATADLLPFLADRLKVHLREQGVRHDLIQAVFALGGEDDLVRLLARVEALSRFVASDDGENLLIAFRRASNIVAAEEKKAGDSFTGAVDPSHLTETTEKALHQALSAADTALTAALKDEDFAAAMLALAALRAPLDAFFENVIVNADDPTLRINRLRLLTHIRSAMGKVADFGEIEG